MDRWKADIWKLNILDIKENEYIGRKWSKYEIIRVIDKAENDTVRRIIRSVCKIDSSILLYYVA